jgi:hypothetical protein
MGEEQQRVQAEDPNTVKAIGIIKYTATPAVVIVPYAEILPDQLGRSASIYRGALEKCLHGCYMPCRRIGIPEELDSFDCAGGSGQMQERRTDKQALRKEISTRI